MLMSLIAEVSCCTLFAMEICINGKQNKTIPKSTSIYPLNPLFSIALPSSGSRLFGSFTWFLEPIIFIKALAVTGITSIAATTLYGTISGVLIPLLLFPSFIPYALSIVLIPAVSDAYARKNLNLLKERIHLSLKFSTLNRLLCCYTFLSTWWRTR